jgi:hypothetical protein
MSEYLEEAVWREQYRDLVGGVRLIAEAVEEAFGPTEFTASSVQECQHLAIAIASHAEKMRRRITELEQECEGPKDQIALTGRVSVEEIIDDVSSIAAL